MMAKHKMTDEDMALVRKFVKHLNAKAPREFYTHEKQKTLRTLYGRSLYAWRSYGFWRSEATRCIYFYQHELDEPKKEWRPSIIMRTVLESAKLMEETGGIPE